MVYAQAYVFPQDDAEKCDLNLCHILVGISDFVSKMNFQEMCNVTTFLYVFGVQYDCNSLNVLSKAIFW